jgi:hypothetical protein
MHSAFRRGFSYESSLNAKGCKGPPLNPHWLKAKSSPSFPLSMPCSKHRTNSHNRFLTRLLLLYLRCCPPNQILHNGVFALFGYFLLFASFSFLRYILACSLRPSLVQVALLFNSTSSRDFPCCRSSPPLSNPATCPSIAPHTSPILTFAALAVLLDFLLQVTAFVALVTLDFRRAEGGRVDCLPCLHVAGREDDISGETRPRSRLQAYMEVKPGGIVESFKQN